jgi:uncharacterized protein YunC (DUF1805 family)
VSPQQKQKSICVTIYLKPLHTNKKKKENPMIEVTPIKIEDKTALGLKAELPESPAPLVMIMGTKGLVCCGFINIDAAERLGVAAAMVSGVKTFDDVLTAEVKAATTKAQIAGVIVGMKGKDALKQLL